MIASEAGIWIILHLFRIEDYGSLFSLKSPIVCSAKNIINIKERLFQIQSFRENNHAANR